MRRGLAFASCLPAAAVAFREHWAVIVAGSKGYENYRHQADACHAYQIARSNGIAEDHIIMMAYDDMAYHSRNPFPGRLFNKPADGEGVDVYAGCQIDYKGNDVTPQNFKDVLTGNATGKSLQSTSEDNVFVFFSDHGAPGLIGFPDDSLHKEELQAIFKTMSDKEMFSKLTFYLESCESGSMFEDMDIPGVYALSAANPNEPSAAIYCGLLQYVNGTDIESCLGDIFSVSWMENVEESDTSSESLGAAFDLIKARTEDATGGAMQSVMQWGDVTFTDDKVAEFVGDLSHLPATSREDVSNSAVSARQVDLQRLYLLYSGASTSAERLRIGGELQQELSSQMAVDAVHTRFLALLYPGDEEKQEAMRTGSAKPSLMECEKSVHTALQRHGAEKFNANSGFALQFHQIVVNVCGDLSMANGSVSRLVNAVVVACSDGVVV